MERSFCSVNSSLMKSFLVATEALAEVRSGRDVVPLLGCCDLARGKLCDALWETS